uniref:NADH-ubiquinone oxidoreductase chain 5 n=1 Tax=Concaveplana hamulusa TaxID=3092773 RepID=A0AAF0YX81_9HEMI|nr:NADH dehydrogenase subunit 5 [Concaveplana hamulusa]WPC85254.1 NADH dehydrogenase subunit 5 [Concaveplana hamulusa]
MNFYFIWSLTMFIFSLMSFYTCIFFNLNNYFMMFEYKLMTLNSLSLYFVIILDWLSLIFMSVVMFISSMVIIYSYNYMGGLSYSSIRFLFLVVLFVFSMILMIMSPNLLSIMLGWDGLGLVSYCLVIYYNSVKSYLAGLVTCLTNRLGDIGLLICISWMMSYGSWHFIFYLEFFEKKLYYLMFLSCFTKSAQIPFSCWLPAAMAAPTPVSSLVHSSTLVTAGVYLLIRFFNMLNFMNYFFLFLSMITMVMSSLCANYEFDLKKIIALSTLSQLGLMMTSLFLGLVDLSFFHLISHAMFKSLIFLCSGIFIYYMNDNQDIRLMGSVCMSMPLTTASFNIASMALCGIPFLSGFYSKDLIVEGSVIFNMNLLIFFMIYLSLGMTMMYSIRLFYYSMMYNNKFISYNKMIDSLNFMLMSISCLSFFSVFFGSMIMWMINLDLLFIILPLNLKVLSIIMVMMGMWIGLESFNFNYLFKINFYLFNSLMWYMYSHTFYGYKYLYKIGSASMTNLCCWGEYYGAMGLSMYLMKTSFFIQHIIMNNMKIFMISFFIWLLLMA